MRMLFYVNSRFKDFPTRANSYKNFKRNYKFMLVGGKEVEYGVDKKILQNNDGLYLASIGQNLMYSYLIVKNYFSHIRKNGIVLFVVTLDMLIGNDLSKSEKNVCHYYLDRYLVKDSDKSSLFIRDAILMNIINYKNKDQSYKMAISKYPLFYPITFLRLIFNDFVTLKKNKKFIVIKKHFVNYVLSDAMCSIENNVIYIKKASDFLSERSLRLAVCILPDYENISTDKTEYLINNFIEQIQKINGIKVFNYFSEKKEGSCCEYLKSLNASKIINDLKID